LCLRDDISLVNGSLHDLLLLRIKVFCEILVKGGLLLL
jgi:hypothetical protein